MTKRLSMLCAALSALCFSAHAAPELTIYYSPTCPHCHHAMDFIKDSLEKEYPGLIVTQVNASIQSNGDEFRSAVKKCKLDSYGVPLVVIGDKCFQGYGEPTGDEYRAAISAGMTDSQVAAGETQSAAEQAAAPAADVKKSEANPPVFLYSLLGILLIALGVVALSKKRRKN